MDSNHRTRKRTDLQSVAVGHLATCPFYVRAREGTRTPDQLITNQLLYQLSYSGWWNFVGPASPRPSSLTFGLNTVEPSVSSFAIGSDAFAALGYPIHITLIYCFFWEGKGR